MSFIAAVLILNLEEADAFIAFANLLNKPCQMAFFRVDHDLVRIHALFIKPICGRHSTTPIYALKIEGKLHCVCDCNLFQPSVDPLLEISLAGFSE